MAIQFRRGLSTDFDPSKLESGEPAFCTDTGEFYIGKPDTPNTAIRMLSTNDNAVVASSVTLNSGYSTTANRVRRIGNILVEIHLYLESPGAFPKGSWVTLGVVDPPCVPSSTVYKICLDNTNGYPVETRINTSGSLSIWIPTSYPDSRLFAADFIYTV